MAVLRVAIRSLVAAIAGGPLVVVGVLTLFSVLVGDMPTAGGVMEAAFLGIKSMAPTALGCACLGTLSLVMIASRKRTPWSWREWGLAGLLLGVVIGPLVIAAQIILTTGSGSLAHQSNVRLLAMALLAGGIVGGSVAGVSTRDLEARSSGGITTAWS